MSILNVIKRIFEGILWNPTVRTPNVRTPNGPDQVVPKKAPTETQQETTAISQTPELELIEEEEPEQPESVGVVVIDDPEILGELEESLSTQDSISIAKISAFDGADPTARARELAKDAVKFKTKDITTAVKMMEEAVKLHPNDTYLARLAYYYSLKGDWRNALATQTERLHLLDPKDLWSYFSAKASIMEDTRKVHARHGDSKRAIFFELESALLRLFVHACRGTYQSELIAELITGATLHKELKKLKKDELQTDVVRRLKDFATTLEPTLAKLSKSTGTSPELAAKRINTDKELESCFNDLKDLDLTEFLTNQIEPLLKERLSLEEEI